MGNKKAIALGCGIAALVVFVVVVAVVLFFVYVAQDVKGVAVSVDGPMDVVVGQTFALSITVSNERPQKALDLSDIDIAGGYLSGFTVASVDPPPKSSTHGAGDKVWSFTFDARVPAQTAKTFTFFLRAERAGLFRGDVDVWEGLRYITGMAQISVKDE